MDSFRSNSLLGLAATASIEEALRASQAMLQMVLDNTPQAVFWKNLDLVFIGCNRSFAIDAGVGIPENIIGKTDFDVAWSHEQSAGHQRHGVLRFGRKRQPH